MHYININQPGGGTVIFGNGSKENALFMGNIFKKDKCNMVSGRGLKKQYLCLILFQ